MLSGSCAIDFEFKKGLYFARIQQVRESLAVRRSAESVTQLLAKWRGGNQEALQALIPLVYKNCAPLRTTT